ncbi:MAG: RluA family pseudouridine synthase [Gammaproteobacteria bacterium]|jgi:23S rRNA pseudouridine955/2504/2580 synthase|nr:RluA family pseudouridine synthase [Gammaproteobacteria bacterium]MBT4492624.1 RluA family pseudouridine synthase [Gammaproteobacteria bacterium]MBT7370235.1 RluA family pseudouridine synthase [Gammaproteobacteria bacterium]
MTVLFKRCIKPSAPIIAINSQSSNSRNYGHSHVERAEKVRLIEIDAETAGQRLDNFLIRTLKGLPKSRVYRIIRKGEVRINGRRAKPQVRLNDGDKVRIPPIRHLPDRDQAIGSFHDLDALILFEDTHLIVINKPAGMAVHGGSGIRTGVIESLRHARPDVPALELVHRLDRGTSGCLMIAKRRSYLRLLQDALRQPGTISKRYTAVVHGSWPLPLESIEEPLLTVSKAGLERFTRVDEAGKKAQTEFRVVSTDQTLSLIEARPMTGRTHQIRVHCRWARHPVVGDNRYGDELLDGGLKQRPRRMLLHARHITIPALGERPALEVTAPLDNDFEEFLNSQPNINI